MESENLEYKKSLSLMDEIFKSISSFANASGGEVLIGFSDEGTLIGASIGKNTLENLAQEIGREIEPKVNISIKVNSLAGKNYVSILVPSSNQKPHFYKGIAYKRVGKINLRLSPSQLEDLFIKRAFSLHDVDELQLRIRMEDLSPEILKKYSKEIGKSYTNPKSILSNLGLLFEAERLLPSAVLFFGNNPSQFFPLYGVKCAIFKNNQMISLKNFSDSIYLNLENILIFLKQILPSQMHFEGIKRIEELLIPESVLREAILNALINSDYTLDATIYISVTEDHLEIKNAGVLPDPLTIEQLKIPHISKPRNRRIADLCFRLGWIEHWGEGTLNMVNQMQKKGLDITFTEQNGYFSIKLHFKPASTNSRLEQLFKFLSTSKKASLKDLKRTGIPERTIRSYLVQLIKKGLVKKLNKGKNTEYSI